MRKYYASNIIYTVLGLTLLAAVFTFMYNIHYAPEKVPPLNRYYAEPDEDTLELERRLFERYRLNNLHVTGEGYDEIGDAINVCVTMEVVSVELIERATDTDGYIRAERFTLVGIDTTDHYWDVYINRDHVRKPDPLTSYQPGQVINVYGYFNGKKYNAEMETRLPHITALLIDIED